MGILTCIGALTAIGYAGLAMAQSLTTNLMLGSRGEEVRLLQQLLNKALKTPVAPQGPGSPGAETDYFGAQTRQAVIRFQEQYAAEILRPAGLTQGTGIVASRTRQKLLQNDKAPETRRTSFAIESISPNRLVPGGIFTVIGASLPPVVELVVDNQPTTVKAPSDGYSATLTLPSKTSIGRHRLLLQSASGDQSNELSATVAFAMSDGTAVPGGPRISQLSPSRGGYGTTVVILGSGFSTLPNNTLHVGYDTISGVASPDGTTLRFTIPSPIPHLNYPKEVLSDPAVAALNPTLPFWIYVENPEGGSNQQLFTFSFYNQ